MMQLSSVHTSSAARNTLPTGSTFPLPRPSSLLQRPPPGLLVPPPRAASKDGSSTSQVPGVLSAPTLTSENNTDGRVQPTSVSERVAGEAQPSTSGRGIPYTLVAGLAGLGALETAYLTFVKLFQIPVACPLSGCETVLNSEYSQLFGLPLSLYGLVAYGGVAALALAARSQAATARTAGSEPSTSSPTDTVLVAGVATLAGCSGVLMYLLATEWQGEACAWCMLSALLSGSLLLAVLAGLSGARQLTRHAAPGAGALIATVAVLYFGFSGISSSKSDDFNLEYKSPVVATESSQLAIDLAHRLRDAGAKMYGAFWCSHCFEQKELFGKAAMEYFPYVECYPEGFRKGIKIAEVCSDANIKAFPTWVLKGETIEGGLELDALEKKVQEASNQ